MKSLKFVILINLFIFCALTSYSQSDLYSSKANAKSDISSAISVAKKEGKNVIIMFGGNWCTWCKTFMDKCTSDPELLKKFRDNYKGIRVEARDNKDILLEYGSPNKFGYPVFVVLNADGKQIHTQDSALLEEGDEYSKVKVIAFLNKWTVSNTK